MNKIRQLFPEQPLSLIVLGLLLTFIFLVGLGLSFAAFFASSLDGQLFSKSFCFTTSCLEEYFSDVGQSLVIAKATFDLCVAIATIGGIFVALLSYFNASGSAALANHIEHLKVFCEYIDSEVEKKDRLSAQLIDSLLLYGFIFNQSRSGRTSVSKDFNDLILGLNVIIQESNAICAAGASSGFDYNKHQRRVRDHLAPAGITIYMAPRKDYFEMEQQILSLLHRIGQSFCSPGSLPELAPRNYY